MMTNIELEEETRKYGIPLVGIFNKDTLPKSPQNGGYIINLQDDYGSDGQDLSGTHWTAFYIEGKKVAYMDSFAFPPPIQVQNFLKPFIPYDYNDKQIQNVSSGHCGMYVISFLKFMTKNKQLPFNQRFQRFLSIYSNNVLKNKTILYSKGI